MEYIFSKINNRSVRSIWNRFSAPGSSVRRATLAPSLLVTRPTFGLPSARSLGNGCSYNTTTLPSDFNTCYIKKDHIIPVAISPGQLLYRKRILYRDNKTKDPTRTMRILTVQCMAGRWVKYICVIFIDYIELFCMSRECPIFECDVGAVCVATGGGRRPE